jgi:hypothetical protein
MKRSSWLETIASSIGSDATVGPEARAELSALDERLFDAWNLGENILLAWTEAGGERRFLSTRHYALLEPFGNGATAEEAPAEAEHFIKRMLAGPKFAEPADFDRLRDLFGRAAEVVPVPVRPGPRIPPELINGVVSRYGVSLVRERAVMLLDAVGFSLHTPLEQVAMLNSLSYSVNSGYRQLISEDVQINFARSSTGDGFYIWNRARTADANIALYKLMMLILADNAVAQSKARRFPVPKLRAAFHVGEHYEFYQVEALNPTTFSYIVGHVTIELSRIIEKALPGQILLGDFSIPVSSGAAGEVTTHGTREFIEQTGALLGQLEGMAVAKDRISRIRCYLTGPTAPRGGFEASRYLIRDKHGLTRTVYNAKINIHLAQGRPIFLGLRHEDLNPPGCEGTFWPSGN